MLSPEEKKLALRNALRYIPKDHHQSVIGEFAREELELYGRIYMYRYKPDYPISARKSGGISPSFHTGRSHHADAIQQPGPGGGTASR